MLTLLRGILQTYLAKKGQFMDLRVYCMIKTDELIKMLSKKYSAVNVDRYVHIDNGESVLAVAHAYVHPRIVDQMSFTQDHSEIGIATRVWSPYLDDRLGIYAIFERLPKLGIAVDILITDGEETGESSAKEFAQNCQKNTTG